MTASLGSERARAYYRAYENAVQSVVSIVEQERIACDLTRNGKLKLAAKPHHYEGLARTCEAIRREVDADVELLSAAEVRSEVGSTEFYGGLLQRNGVQMHIGRFGIGLAEAAARHGALVFEQTTVKGWKASAGGYRVDTSRGSLQAGQVLMATGACQHGGLGWYRRRIVPVGSFIIATERLPDDLVSRLLPGRRSYVTRYHW
ncbi:Gamma-glutamylputrescine oxidoreductase [compost metagenome]